MGERKEELECQVEDTNVQMSGGKKKCDDFEELQITVACLKLLLNTLTKVCF